MRLEFRAFRLEEEKMYWIQENKKKWIHGVGIMGRERGFIADYLLLWRKSKSIGNLSIF